MQRPQLSIVVPKQYANYFEELNDFCVWDPRVSSKPIYDHLPVYLDARKAERIDSDYKSLDGFIHPRHLDPNTNVITNIMQHVEGKENIILWHGGKKHVSLILEANFTVGLPNWQHPRTIFTTKDDCWKSYYYEFCNLDELRRLPPKAIHTCIPITAALMGIDLTRRERRPKKLPEFEDSLKLNPVSLELALLNARAIREALDQGYGLLQEGWDEL